MSMLLQIQSQIDQANLRIVEIERALAEYPGLPSVSANLESVVRWRSNLESQFLDAAALNGVEICKYRAFNSNNERTNAGAAFGAISGFQRLFSVVFGSLKYKKKQQARVDSELGKETAFGFAYGFTGSVGVVLTIPTDSDLFGESYLDDAMSTIFAMAKAEDPKVIQSFADTLGPGAINALYQWASENAEHGLGADVEWRHGKEVKGSLFIQRQQLSKLRTAIEQVSSDTTETKLIEGLLTGVLLGSRKFRLSPDNMPEIRGTFELGAIDAKHKVAIPVRYIAKINVTTTMHFAIGKKRTRYHLLKLNDVPPKEGKNAGKEA